MLGLGRRLPLVRERGSPTSFGQPESEAPDTSKEFRDVSDSLGGFAKSFGRPHQVESIFRFRVVIKYLAGRRKADIDEG